MADRIVHDRAELCRMYGSLGYFDNGINIGIRQGKRVHWFGYSPVDGYVQISDTKDTGGAPFVSTARAEGER